ncbi:MAG: hypothetical protein RIB84_27890 [Sneathiellaceae bacterium]
MPSRSVYEVMVNQGGHWVVQTTTETQGDALRLAERLVTTGREEDVRVLQSFFDDKKRTLVENELKRFRRKAAAKGDASAPVRPPTPLSSRPCNSHSEFYRFESRRVLRAAIMDDLERWVITPLELLYSLPHAQRLNSAGTVLQGGVQRVAMVQSREFGLSIHQRMKALFDFCTEIERELRLIWRNHEIKAVPKGGLRDRMAALADAKNGDFLLHAEIGESLNEAKDWPTKLSLLFDILSAEPDDEEMAVFDSYAAEIIESGPAIKALLGDIGDRADAILALLDIQAGIPVADQSVSPVVERLIRLFREGRLKDCRGVLYRRVRQELESLRSVSGNANDLIRETQVLKVLYQKLARDAEDRADARLLLGTLEGRASAILRSETLGAKLQSQKTPIGQIDLLLRLAPGILGAANKRKIAAFLVGLLDSEETKGIVLGGDAIVESRMKQFRKWEDSARGAEFDQRTEEELTGLFDRLCVEAMRKSQYFAKLQRDMPVPSVRALKLMELVAEDGLTTGVARRATQAELIKLLKDAATLGALAESVQNDPGKTERLRELYTLLSQQTAASA